MTGTKQDHADAAVVTAEAELAAKESALADESQRLTEMRTEAEAAAEKRRLADPFNETEFLKRGQAAEVAAAKVRALQERVEAQRARVDAAREALETAHFDQGLARLEKLHEQLASERARVEKLLMARVEAIRADLKGLHALTSEAAELQSDLRWSPVDGARKLVPEHPASRWDDAALRAADESSSIDHVLEKAAIALQPRVEPTAAELEHQRRNFEANHRLLMKNVTEAAERFAEEAERRKRFRTNAARVEEENRARLLEPPAKSSDHDYPPHVG
jgi:hypothetical protein